MRILLPALLTLPSSTVDTFSCLPILRMSSVLPLNTKTDVRAGTRNPLIWDKAVHRSSVIPSPRYSFSFSALMFTKGNTATPAAGGGSGLLFQIITPTVAAKASDNANSSAVVGLRSTHFFPRVKTPVCRARIGWCRNQRSRSSASARAESYRRVGSFSRHFRQIVERSRSTFGFQRRGCRGSVSSTNLIVSYVVPPAKGG